MLIADAIAVLYFNTNHKAQSIEQLIFPQVYLFPVREPNNGNEVQNIILIALKSKDNQNFNDTDPELNEYLQHLWKKEIDDDVPILTDDFAPVDYYISKTI